MGDAVELPPRARRIHGTPIIIARNEGTTSACAENTTPRATIEPPHGNYLRVRGEYVDHGVPADTTWELPPRARRILSKSQADLDLRGTTSACAENTRHLFAGKRKPGNYLRVRGEYCEFAFG